MDPVARARPSRVVRWLPAAGWLRDYDRGLLAQDAVAALIVTLMLVPQSLAYAMLAGLPPQVGLYASIAPLIAYAAFGSSRTLSVGPVAVVSLMTAVAIGNVAAGDPARAMQASLALALLSGGAMLLMAALRLGTLSTLLSHPVISGFVTASAVLIATGQLKHLLGVQVQGDTLVELLPGLVQAAPRAHLPTLLIGVLALAFLVWARSGLAPTLRRLRVPAHVAGLATRLGPVVVIAAATAAVALGGPAVDGVRVVGPIPAGLPPVTLPPLDPALWIELLPAAVATSLIGFVESMSVAQTLAARRREQVDADRELLGLGAANVAAAFTGGYPVTGGFARSVVNFDAGARTQLASVLTALGILAVTLLFTRWFADLPHAALAATIIIAVLALADFAAPRQTWRYSRGDFAAMAATMGTVLLVGVEAGIIAGVAVSVLMHLWRTTRPHIAIVGQVPGTEHFRNIDRHPVVTSPTVLSARVDESLYFANARFLEQWLLAQVAQRPGVRHVVS
ncbi:MAG: SulP family inorganic anion transporter [Pseudomonadota bacterium]